MSQNKILLINTVRANFEFIGKLGVNFWCFHDRDIALDGKTRGESIFKFLHLIAILRQDQSVRCSGICLLFFIYGIFSYDHSRWNVLSWLILCCYIFKSAFWAIGLHLLSLSQESNANLDEVVALAQELQTKVILHERLMYSLLFLFPFV